MSKKVATRFPGQGSQSVGMLAQLAAAYPLVHDTFAEGSDAPSVDLWTLSQNGPTEQLNDVSVPSYCALMKPVEEISRRGADIVLEAGPGKVLAGLIKRIDKSPTALPVFDPSSLDTAMETINA